MYKEVIFGTKKKWSYKKRWPLKRGLNLMKLSMTGQEKSDLLMQVTA